MSENAARQERLENELRAVGQTGAADGLKRAFAEWLRHGDALSIIRYRNQIDFCMTRNRTSMPETCHALALVIAEALLVR
jgi:hypothetical protein